MRALLPPSHTSITSLRLSQFPPPKSLRWCSNPASGRFSPIICNVLSLLPKTCLGPVLLNDHLLHKQHLEFTYSYFQITAKKEYFQPPTFYRFNLLIVVHMCSDVEYKCTIHLTFNTIAQKSQHYREISIFNKNRQNIKQLRNVNIIFKRKLI